MAGSSLKRPAISSFPRTVCCLFAGFLFVIPASGFAAPRVPTDDNEVLERLPVRPNDPAMRELKTLRAALAREPRNLDIAIKLAKRYFDQAMAQGDPRYV